MINHSRPYITKEDLFGVQQVLESGNIAKGAKVDSFEIELAKYINAASAFATGSGTSALILALKAVGIEKNDEVIIPTYVCRNVMDAVKSVGAIPVFCDIESEWNMTAKNVKMKITPRTKAIIVVHLFGIPAEAEEIRKLGFAVIEDCCQSLGARSYGKTTDISSDLAMYSFHATKLLTTGEGGAVTTGSKEIAARITELMENNSVASLMSDIQAALGMSQLQKYSQMLATRKKIAVNYCSNIKTTRAMLPHEILEKSIFFRFPILVKKLDFEKTRINFLEKGVHVRHGVDALLHRLCGLDDKDYPNAVNAFNNTLSIPIYPALSMSEQEQIIEASNIILS